MNLFLIVWQYDEPDRECEWTHFVSEKDYIDSDEEREIIANFMRENMDQEPDDYEVSDSWCNKVSMIDNYKINLEKAGK